jgi:hypothetical protein
MEQYLVPKSLAEILRDHLLRWVDALRFADAL